MFLSFNCMSSDFCTTHGPVPLRQVPIVQVVSGGWVGSLVGAFCRALESCSNVSTPITRVLVRMRYRTLTFLPVHPDTGAVPQNSENVALSKPGLSISSLTAEAITMPV